MQGNRKRRHWPADRIPLERTIMVAVLAAYPLSLAIHEPAWEIGSRAVIELRKVRIAAPRLARPPRRGGEPKRSRTQSSAAGPVMLARA